jgi:uncharacterized protein YbcI
MRILRGMANADMNVAIANAISRIHREHYGRGPASSRAVLDRDHIAVFLEDGYTPMERTLISAGKFDTVRHTRHEFQRALRSEFVGAVEKVTGRKVRAFMSEVHQDPDVSVEIFVLEPAD